MGVVSVRIDDEAEAYLRSHGISAGTLGRELLEAEVRKRQLREARARLEARRLKLDRPSLKLIREARDAN